MMSRIATVSFGIIFLLLVDVRAEDWPTYRHDNQRKGWTAERIAAKTLQVQWVWRSPSPPQPAWAGPARWDAYANIRGLRSMRNYDLVFHVIAADGALWFGSTADDTVRCLDVSTGKEKWSYTTGGPVRIAPTYAEGHLYFGSDDGFAYCLQAGDGRLVWKFAPGSRERLILNNGRPIPLWPCRTGVLVVGDTAYFTAGMLPWEKTYLCAVDAKTGDRQGAGRYVKTYDGKTMEGALLASHTRLFVPQGRVPPLVLQRSTGAIQGMLKKGGGGSFVLLTDDDQVLHGPGNKTGWITQSRVDTRDQVANFPHGRAMVVTKSKAYLLTDNSLTAIDRATREKDWTTPFNYPYELIRAGDVLFAGGRDAVAAVNATTGESLWRGEVSGRVYGLAVANGSLFVSTDLGAIYCFRPGLSSNSVQSSGKPTAEQITPSGGILLGPQASAPLTANASPRQPTDRGTRARSRQPESPILAFGPYLRFTGPTEAVVQWETREPFPTRLSYETGGWSRKVEDAKPQTRHQVRLTALRRNTVYRYTIEVGASGQSQTTQAYECDTFFNYSLPAIPDRPCPYPAADQQRYVMTAKNLLRAPDVDRGVCVVLGCGDGRLVYELACRSKLRVIGLETSAEQVTAARKALLAAGVYGSRTTVLQVASLKKTNLAGYLADAVFTAQNGLQAEALRLARPGGVVFHVSVPARPTLSQTTSSADKNSPVQQMWRITRRPQPDGVGVWSHQYGRPDNAAFGGETLAGATGTDDLLVQWLGRPGPRAQADRNGRKPAPLSVNGRLFVQGLHRIIALSAYNGSILWSLEIPKFERFNIPRDCGNWCLDDRYVFAVVRDKCWQIDARDGTVSKRHDVVPGSHADWTWDWGYVARPDAHRLIGSAVRQGTSWTGFWGRTGWYDARTGAVTDKICSDNLFALDVETGRRTWVYTGGLILNPTIAITGSRVYFVECRNPKVAASESRRVGMSELWQDQYLVALDLTTGRRLLWQQPIDTADGTVVYYLACAEDKLVLVSSVASEARYHVDARDAKTGEPVWHVGFPWPKDDKGRPIDNHGRHMSRPAIVAGRVFVRPAVIDLATGKLLKTGMGVSGCGTYALTSQTAIYRAGNVTLWDFRANKASSWQRLRPDCWLSTIPACGMVLSPEAGGGCSCGSWLETSVGFIPKNRAAATFDNPAAPSLIQP